MYQYFLFLSFLGALTANAKSFHSPEPKPQLLWNKTGDFTIAALFRVHTIYMRGTSEFKCDEFFGAGIEVLSLEAFKFAIERVNQMKLFRDGSTIGAVAYDLCVPDMSSPDHGIDVLGSHMFARKISGMWQQTSLVTCCCPIL